MKKITLNEIKPGNVARVEAVNTKGSMRRRFLDIGLVPGTAVECVGVAALGDPKAMLIRGAVIAVREDDLRTVTARIE